MQNPRNPCCSSFYNLQISLRLKFVIFFALLLQKHTIPLLNNFWERIDRDSPNRSNRRRTSLTSAKKKQTAARQIEIYSPREIGPDKRRIFPQCARGISMRLASGQVAPQSRCPLTFTTFDSPRYKARCKI